LYFLAYTIFFPFLSFFLENNSSAVHLFISSAQSLGWTRKLRSAGRFRKAAVQADQQVFISHIPPELLDWDFDSQAF
jgi:hypothetical protein